MSVLVDAKRTFSKFFLRNQSWFWTHLGVITMGLMLLHDPNKWKLLTPYSGYLSVCFFATTLSLNPLKTLKPNWVIIKRMNRYRRMLGVAAFSYAVIHISCFIIKRGSIENTLPYLVHPALIPVVWLAFPILLVMAATSNNFSIKKLGFVKWKKVHVTGYVAEVAIIVHMFLVGELFWAGVIFTPLILLQFARRRLKKRHAAAILEI
ncbi:MAG: hypothetical protein FJX71_04390 [Alphaproteobacteria bacterium]|nr:hypothetical protein [Alphaproteobacteria bacterium]